jgi:hypothetical protein
MAAVTAVTLLAVAQSVFGRPIDTDAPHNLTRELSPIGVSCFPGTLACHSRSLFQPLSIQIASQATQTPYIHSIDTIVPPASLLETRPASSAPGTTTALLSIVSGSTTTPSQLWVPVCVLVLIVVVPLVILVAYKAVLAHRRAASFATPSPVSPTPLITNIRVVAVTEVPARFEGDETMRSVRDFWSPISPGLPELHVEYKNMEVEIGTAVDPATTHLPLLARNTSGFFYDLDHVPATPRAGTTEYTPRSPPSVGLDGPAAAPEDEPTDQADHERISTVPVLNEEGICTPPSTPNSVRTMCTLTSVSSSLSLYALETPTKASRRQRSVLGTANGIPVIRIIEATPERYEKKAQGYVQRFNSRAITPKQAKLQNLI